LKGHDWLVCPMWVARDRTLSCIRRLEVHDPVLGPREIGQGAFIVTVEAMRWGGAQRTRGAGLGRVHPEGDLRRRMVDLTRDQAQRSRIG